MKQKCQDDGLFIDSAGTWAEQKHKLIAHYARMFATSMKNKWQCRVYIDLFSSSGLAIIKGTSRIVKTSPLLSLDIPDQFDRYIFCDIEKEKIETLKERVSNICPKVDVKYHIGDCNKLVDTIIRSIPSYSRNYRVLSFCVIDPYKIDSFSFQTLEKLSARFMDFLVLIPSFMDANRNTLNYFNGKSKVVEKYLGYQDWRSDWESEKSKGLKFGTFLVLKFNERMCSLRYICLEPNEYVLIRNPKRNVPLYHLAFYSKNPLGKKFWNDARKGANAQLDLQDQLNLEWRS